MERLNELIHFNVKKYDVKETQYVSFCSIYFVIKLLCFINKFSKPSHKLINRLSVRGSRQDFNYGASLHAFRKAKDKSFHNFLPNLAISWN